MKSKWHNKQIFHWYLYLVSFILKANMQIYFIFQLIQKSIFDAYF